MLREVKESASGHIASKEQSIDSNPGSQAPLSDGIERAEPIGTREGSGRNSSAQNPAIEFPQVCLCFSEKFRSSGTREAHTGILVLEPITHMALCRPSLVLSSLSPKWREYTVSTHHTEYMNLLPSRALVSLLPPG